ncbi:MAG: diguanylate cyclase [Mariprofundaceae bacterium]|nr:diguanylate cyclase [Mariprofundaceae bacterium]
MGMCSAKTLSILKYTAVVFLPIVIVVGMASVYNDRLVMASNLKILQDRETNQIAMQKDAIQNAFKNIISDLEVVSLHSDLEQLLSHESEAELAKHQQDLGGEFLAFIHHKDAYNQLSILNQYGMEIIRVEKTAESEQLVSTDKLQNKVDRSYFVAAIHGVPESIYISPISLNIEQQQVGEIYKPVIQLSMSLANEKGDVAGVLVLDYLAEHLFAVINNDNASSVTQLIDSNGFWIKAEDSNDEWGDILDERENRAFKFDYSAAWETIAQSERGQFINEKGMFTFAKINPFEMHYRQGHSKVSYVATLAKPSNTWVLLSYISPDILKQEVENKDSITAVNQVIFIFILFILVLIIARKRIEHIEDLSLIKQTDIRLHAVVDTALDGIITIDEKGIISSSNPAACKMFAYEEYEMVGDNIRMIVPSPHKKPHDDYINRYLETRHARIVNNTREVDAERKDGSIFPIELCVGAKEFDGSWLFTGIIRDITERKALTEKLEKMAISDALTGIYNRGYFTRQLNEEFLRSKRYQLNLSLMMLDLDHFKDVNDQYGHPAGDAVLIAFANQIQKSIRNIDVLARYGGEEFAIIMPETDSDGAQIIAERIRNDVEAMEVNIVNHVVKRTVSIGIACFTNDSIDESADAFLIRADDALYKAKHSGRNRVVLCERD